MVTHSPGHIPGTYPLLTFDCVWIYKIYIIKLNGYTQSRSYYGYIPVIDL